MALISVVAGNASAVMPYRGHSGFFRYEADSREGRVFCVAIRWYGVPYPAITFVSGRVSSVSTYAEFPSIWVVGYRVSATLQRATYETSLKEREYCMKWGMSFAGMGQH